MSRPQNSCPGRRPLARPHPELDLRRPRQGRHTLECHPPDFPLDLFQHASQFLWWAKHRQLHRPPAACAAVTDDLNGRVHWETGRAPVDMLVEERPRLHVLPVEAHTAALREPQAVGDDQTTRWGSVHYSTPDGHQGKQVWCRIVGDELGLTARTQQGLAEICRHLLSTSGRPQATSPPFDPLVRAYGALPGPRGSPATRVLHRVARTRRTGPRPTVPNRSAGGGCHDPTTRSTGRPPSGRLAGRSQGAP
jgi:hypothetical protein